LHGANYAPSKCFKHGRFNTYSGIEAMIDVMKDLRERFDFSAYMILSAWEYELDGMIDERTMRDFTD
jgi:hypothetical protein